MVAEAVAETVAEPVVAPVVTGVAEKRSQWSLIVVVGFALAVDYLLAGLLTPLTPFSPAGISKVEQLATLTASYAAGTLLTTPIFGYLGDRFGCRRLIIGGALMLGPTAALFAWAPNFAVMVGASTLQGISAAATWTAGLAVIAERYSGDRVRMMGFALMGSTGGSVVGPVLAGALYDIAGYRLPFYAVMATIALDLLALIFFLPADDRNQPPAVTVFSLLTDRTIAGSAFAVMLASAAWSVVQSVVPIRVVAGGAGPAQVGMLFTATTVVYGLCTPFVTWLVGRFGPRRTAGLGVVSMALAVPLVGVSANIFAAAAAITLVQISYAFLLNPQSALMGDAAERRGLNSYCAVYSVYNFIYTLGTIVISMLAAVILPYVSLQTVLLCLSGVLLLSIPALLVERVPDPKTKLPACGFSVG